MTHTETPWSYVYPNEVSIPVYGENAGAENIRLYLRNVDKENDGVENNDNARFIVQACNMHDELVRELGMTQSLLFAVIADLKESGMTYIPKRLQERLDSIDSLISKAKGL